MTSSDGLSTVPALVEAVYRAMEEIKQRSSPNLRASSIIENQT